jgi:PKD repeat protein
LVLSLLRRVSAAALGRTLVLAALLGAVGCATASAVVVPGPGGRRVSVAPPTGVTPASLPGSLAARHARTTVTSSVADNGTLAYHGGPVLHTTDPYLVFWDPSSQIPTATQSLLRRFFTDLAGDPGAGGAYAVGRQYYDASGYADQSHSFVPARQAITDPQGFPSPAASSSCPTTDSSGQITGIATCVTDDQVTAELSRLIAAGGLPTGDGEHAPVYFVVLPPNVNECYTDTSSTPAATYCADSDFCAYHSYFDGQSGSTILYAVIPTILAAQNPKGCQWDGNSAAQEPNGGYGDIVLKYLSHEDNEAITDPLITSWYDSSTGQENADECNFYGSSADPSAGNSPNAFSPTLGGDASAGTLYDQTLSGHNYYLQSEWSNGDLGCEMAPVASTLTASLTAPAAATPGAAVALDPAASVAARGFSSATWDFGDGSATTFQQGAPASVHHTYATAGVYTVKLTVVDAAGNLASTTRTLTIAAPPVAAFSVSATSTSTGTTLSFDGTASSTSGGGDQIQSYAWNFGDGGSAATAQPQHTYTTAGTYTVSLTVTDSNGLTSAPATRQITVTDPATPTTTTTPPAGTTTTPVATSTPPAGTTATPAGTTATPGGTTATPAATTTTAAPAAPPAPGRIAAVSVRHRVMAITLTGAGILRIGSHTYLVTGARKLAIKLSLTRAQERTLKRTHHLTVRVTLRFASYGTRQVKRVKLRLRLRG